MLDREAKSSPPEGEFITWMWKPSVRIGDKILATLQILGVQGSPNVDGQDVSTKPSSWTGLDRNRGVELALSRGIVLSHKQLRAIHGKKAFFAHADLSGDLSFCDFYDTDFRCCTIHQMQASHPKLLKCVFSEDISPEKLTPASNRSEQYKEVNCTTFNGCTLNSAEFNASTMCFADFRICDLSASMFIAAKLVGASFYDCGLNKVDFSYTHCEGAVFNISSGKQIKFFNAYCTDAQFKHGDFSETSFISATLDRALFEDVILTGADFSRASLKESNLLGARGLTEEQLRQAKTLEGAKLPPHLAQKLADLVKNVSTSKRPPPSATELRGD